MKLIKYNKKTISSLLRRRKIIFDFLLFYPSTWNFFINTLIYTTLSLRVASILPFLPPGSSLKAAGRGATHTHTGYRRAFLLVFYEIKGGKVPINKERYRGILKGGGDAYSRRPTLSRNREGGEGERERIYCLTTTERARERERESERERVVLLTIKK